MTRVSLNWTGEAAESTATAGATQAKRQGPAIRVEASCNGCAHELSKSYAVQGDSGFDVSCLHPKAPERNRIGDSMWRTPDWCPLMPVVADDQLAADLENTRYLLSMSDIRSATRGGERVTKVQVIEGLARIEAALAIRRIR